MDRRSLDPTWSIRSILVCCPGMRGSTHPVSTQRTKPEDPVKPGKWKSVRAHLHDIPEQSRVAASNTEPRPLIPLLLSCTPARRDLAATLVPGLRGLRDAPLLSRLGGVIDACAGSQNWSHGQLAAAHWFSAGNRPNRSNSSQPSLPNRPRPSTQTRQIVGETRVARLPRASSLQDAGGGKVIAGSTARVRHRLAVRLGGALRALWALYDALLPGSQGDGPVSGP